jgi:hypothetical protein
MVMAGVTTMLLGPLATQLAWHTFETKRPAFAMIGHAGQPLRRSRLTELTPWFIASRALDAGQEAVTLASGIHHQKPAIATSGA